MADHVRKIFDALRVEMNLRIRLCSKARKLLGKATLRAVAAIQKRRNYGEAQISGSNWPESDLPSRRFRRERKGLWLGAEITSRDRARDKHSTGNLHTTGFLQRSRETVRRTNTKKGRSRRETKGSLSTILPLANQRCRSPSLP